MTNSPCSTPIFFTGYIGPGEVVSHEFFADCPNEELRVTFQWPQHGWYGEPVVYMGAALVDENGAGINSASKEVWQDIIQGPGTWFPGLWTAYLRNTGHNVEPYIISVYIGEWAKIPTPGRPG